MSMFRFRRAKPEGESTTQQLPGVIDTIGLGYSHLLNQPSILLVPFLLDLLFWSGARVGIGPITSIIADWLDTFGADGESLAGTVQQQAGFNILELLSFWSPMLRLPTYLPLASSSESTLGGIAFSSLPWPAVVVIGVAAFLVSLVVVSGYLIGVEDATSGRTPHLAFSRIVRHALSFLIWLVVAVLLLVFVSTPLMLVGALLAALGVGGTALVSLLVGLPLFWGFIFLFFSFYAIVIDGRGALGGMQSSYRVVRAYFWQTIGFIVIYEIVTGAFPFVFQRLESQPAGYLLASIGYAFIGSGMIAAGLIFYRDRARRLGLPAAMSSER